MSHKGRFVTDQIYTVDIPDDLSRQTTDFHLLSPIAEQNYEFGFQWNSKHNYYSVRIIRGSDDETLLKFYPESNEPHIVKNFNTVNPDHPHAIVRLAFQRFEGLEEWPISDISPMPHTISDNFIIAVQLGELL